MALVRGCMFPDDLFCDVPHHTLYKPEADGLLRTRMTPVAIAFAHEVLVFTPKRAGSEFEKGRSFATIESAKWIGAVRAAFDGVVMVVNEALIDRPIVANSASTHFHELVSHSRCQKLNLQSRLASCLTARIADSGY